MLVWAPSADHAARKAAVKELKGAKLPYLAIVHMDEKTRKLTVKSIHHFKVSQSVSRCECHPLARGVKVAGVM